MSTILKALKKLEHEQETRKSNGSGSIPDFNAGRSVQQAVKRVRFRGRGLKMGMTAGALLALGVAAYFYLNKSSPAHLPTSKQAQEAVASRAPTVTRRPSDHAASHMAKPRATVSPETGKAEKMRPRPYPKSLNPRQSAAPGEVASAAPINHAAGRTEPQAKPDSPVAPLVPAFAPKRAEVPAGLPQTPTPAKETEEPARFAGAERLSDGRLKVQAIAWSPDARERMAVINNRVVREGETVDSFTIVAIESDEVVAKEGPKIWKVAFGSP